MRASLVLVSLVLALSSATGCVVVTNTERGDKTLQAEGWTKLGERWVQGDKDADVIEVGRAEGKFRKLVLVVEHASLNMYDMEIEFADGSTHTPKTRFTFQEGVRSNEIDLPGDARVIKQIKFKYGNVGAGGKSQIEVWGR